MTLRRIVAWSCASLLGAGLACGGAAFTAQNGASSSDAGALDASAANDGAPIGSDAATDAPLDKLGCAAHPNAFFCDDFERASDAGAGWSYTTTKVGGTVVLDRNDSVSPATSLLATGANGSTAVLGLDSTKLPPLMNVTVDFDMSLTIGAGPFGTTGNDYIGITQVASGNSGEVSFGVESQPAGPSLYLVVADTGATTAPYAPGGAVKPGWHHVRIAVTFSTTNGSASLDVDGVRAADLSVPTLRSAAMSPFFMLGPELSGTTPSVTARFDNVVWNAQ